MRKVNTAKGPVWINIEGVKQSIASEPQFVLRPNKHSSNPETSRGYEAAVAFYKETTKEKIPALEESRQVTATTHKKEFEIDMSKFIPYEDESPTPTRKSKSLTAYGANAEDSTADNKRHSVDSTIKKGGEWEWRNFLLLGKKKDAAPQSGADTSAKSTQIGAVTINTEGVADILKELKEEKGKEQEREEENVKPGCNESEEQKLSSGDEPVGENESVHSSDEATEQKMEPKKIPELNDDQLIAVVQQRLVRMQRLEEALAEMTRKYNDAELTAEQLMVKLGKEKEKVEDLKAKVAHLEKHNAELEELAHKAMKHLAEKVKTPATPPSTVRSSKKKTKNATTPVVAAPPNKLW